jgi:Leucine-rich repeat (LRR) protein
MVQISFGLIRRANPDVDFDNIESVDTLKLEMCEITEIDNLELFSHIKNLYLSGNNISKIENISLFDNLRHLDVSCNNITGEGLRKSIGGIPKNLESINLSGNPCVNDETALLFLQDNFQQLGIVIDVVDANVQDSGGENEDDHDESEAENVHSETSSGTVVDADQVLQYIVERKCKIQSYSHFNLDSTVSVGRDIRDRA